MNYKIKFSILIIIFLLLNSVLVYFLRNFFLEIKKISSEISLKKSETFSLDKKAKISEDFSDLFQKEKNNFKKVESLFISSEIPVEFINFLEQTAKNYNLNFQLSILKPIEEKDVWPSLNFQINLAGFYLDFFKFLKKLSDSPYLVEIQSLEIFKMEKTTIEKEIIPGNIKANLLIKVYSK